MDCDEIMSNIDPLLWNINALSPEPQHSVDTEAVRCLKFAFHF